MSQADVRVSPAWLALREAADAEARATDLVARARRHLPAGERAVIHDLGCGTGSMGRWLAPMLAGPQHWVLHDRDAELLAHAAATMPGKAGDGSPVTLETRLRDITRLDSDDLVGASLITASALIDLVTAEELGRLVTACSAAGCPVLLTICPTGRVDVSPADPLDAPVAEAFNAHQRRTSRGRRLLGPDALDVASAGFSRLGHEVLVRPSSWRLGAARSALATEWLSGWVRAAIEQRPDLGPRAERYLQRRTLEAEAAQLRVTVHHRDLLVVPR